MGDKEELLESSSPLCFKKPKASWVLPDLKSNNKGKFGMLTGIDLANILAFVGVSGSSKVVEHGRLLCSAEIQVSLLHISCCCSSQIGVKTVLAAVSLSHWLLEVKIAVYSLKNLNLKGK